LSPAVELDLHAFKGRPRSHAHRRGRVVNRGEGIMRYLALATDYDGTLAHDGRVDDAAVKALERLRESGRRLLLVTGRELEELLAICPRIELFDRIVAENGALLYRPKGREEKALAP